MSSLASAIGLPGDGPWHKNMDESWRSNSIPRDHPLHLLHAKFWGKSMADEEQEWVRSSNNQDGEGRMRGFRNDQDGDDRTSEDGDERTDEYDIMPGCYLLEIGIDGLEYSKFWIRSDYIRAYDRVEEHFKTRAPTNNRPPAAVLTGQPGIGAFLFLFLMWS
jgi:hypothetical protein